MTNKRKEKFLVERKSPNFLIRVILTLITVAIIFANTSSNLILLNTYTNECIFDRTFEISSPIYDFLKENPKFRYILVIISSFIIDYSVALMGYLFIVYGKSWRPYFSFSFFYILRLSVNAIFMLRYPDQVMWEYPGFPSFTVSYFRSSDFFFSGHVGMNFISAMETNIMGFKKLSYISFLGIFVQFFVMIIVRGHYLIDLIAGLLAAHYFCHIADNFSPYLKMYINLDHEEEFKKRITTEKKD